MIEFGQSDWYSVSINYDFKYKGKIHILIFELNLESK